MDIGYGMLDCGSGILDIRYEVGDVGYWMFESPKNSNSQFDLFFVDARKLQKSKIFYFSAYWMLDLRLLFYKLR
jgi:hypothetical protein